MKNISESISLRRVMGARDVLRPYLKPSPLRNYKSLDRNIGARVHIKHENLNPTGTFKIRGGINLMHNLSKDGVKGVITYSTGNHGVSTAASAGMFGLNAVVVVPENSNPLKVAAIKDAGAELIEYGVDFEEAGRKVEELVEERGLYFVHPANEPHLINGVGTEFLEIIEQVPDLEIMLVPIGAGSEVAAAITVLKSINPKIEVIAVQAEMSQAAYKSWKDGQIVTSPNNTFAGGFATGTAYEVTFSIYRELLDDFVLLSEEELYEGIALAAHHTRNLAEGSGGSCLRAAFKIKDRLAGRKVAVQMSGSNASGPEIREAMTRQSLITGLPG